MKPAAEPRRPAGWLRGRGWRAPALLACLLGGLFAGVAHAQWVSAHGVMGWSRVPPEWRDRYGGHRPVMQFRDGTRVETREDWARRRTELLDEWRRRTGPWPFRVPEPRLEAAVPERVAWGTRRRVRFEVEPGRMRDAWLTVPGVPGSRPAVVIVGGDGGEDGPGDTVVRLEEMIVRAGMVALRLGYPGGDPRNPPETGCQPLSYLACLADQAAGALGREPGVDPVRIGIVGRGLGGRWALFSGALSGRFAAVVAWEPGLGFELGDRAAGYHVPWQLGRPLAGMPEGGHEALLLHDHDLHELVALIAPHRFLLVGGKPDPETRWEALNHAILVSDLLGRPGRVGFLRPGPAADETSLATACAGWFHESLGAGRVAATGR